MLSLLLSFRTRRGPQQTKVPILGRLPVVAIRRDPKQFTFAGTFARTELACSRISDHLRAGNNESRRQRLGNRAASSLPLPTNPRSRQATADLSLPNVSAAAHLQSMPGIMTSRPFSEAITVALFPSGSQTTTRDSISRSARSSGLPSSTSDQAYAIRLPSGDQQ
jgi:hypothetical protein